MKQGYFKTGYRLKTFIEHAEKIDGATDFLDGHFHYLFLDCDQCENKEALHPRPYWLETWEARRDKPIYSFGSQGIHDGETYSRTLGERILNKYKIHYAEPTPDDVYVQYVEGYHDGKQYGDVIRNSDGLFAYVDSVALPEEVSHQSDDGQHIAEYRGASFLRVWAKISDGLI